MQERPRQPRGLLLGVAASPGRVLVLRGDFPGIVVPHLHVPAGVDALVDHQLAVVVRPADPDVRTATRVEDGFRLVVRDGHPTVRHLERVPCPVRLHDSCDIANPYLLHANRPRPVDLVQALVRLCELAEGTHERLFPLLCAPATAGRAEHARTEPDLVEESGVRRRIREANVCAAKKKRVDVATVDHAECFLTDRIITAASEVDAPEIAATREGLAHGHGAAILEPDDASPGGGVGDGLEEIFNVCE
mmetsp:Transcript_56993/g.135960  ORF Transcript_56993/g.135960 Transcript_56993/m.135960 type:complete len:248 (+) Transcript_56993:142-885(+)